jgi:hypothetical protein
MLFSPASCHFIPLRSKYSPEHSVLKHTQFENKDLANKNPELQFMTHESTSINRWHHQLCAFKLPHDTNDLNGW